MEATEPLVLIVDDEEIVRDNLADLVAESGFRTVCASDGEAALRTIRAENPDLLLLDVMMPGMDGMEVLKKAQELDPDLPVVMITGNADIKSAVETMKAGAHDYLAKPFRAHEALRVIHRALKERELKLKIKRISTQIEENLPLSKIMGPSEVIGRLTAEINRLAPSDLTVVLFGETGSGKEVVARETHRLSSRARGPFVAIDCGAIPETLLESELFGHEKGAFTGAVSRKPGKFELAAEGTLFLDEIANMPLGIQAKLLRVLQERSYYRVGGTKLLDFKARIVAASNQDLAEAAASGSLREDLFYRLNDYAITIPPLRKRREDILFLAKRFLDLANAELNREVRGFSDGALNTLMSYDWPGNVRQLRSTIRRGVLMADDLVEEGNLNLKRASTPGLAFTPQVDGMPWKDLSLKEIVRRSTAAVEREVIAKVLEHTGGNKAQAARLLKLDYKTLHTKVKQLGISPKK